MNATADKKLTRQERAEKAEKLAKAFKRSSYFKDAFSEVEAVARATTDARKIDAFGAMTPQNGQWVFDAVTEALAELKDWRITGYETEAAAFVLGWKFPVAAFKGPDAFKAAVSKRLTTERKNKTTLFADGMEMTLVVMSEAGGLDAMRIIAGAARAFVDHDV